MPGMAVALAIFGAAFAAFCVWLTVRIVNRRERWAKWLALALAILTVAGYPASVGLCVGVKSYRASPKRLKVIDLDSDFYGIYKPIMKMNGIRLLTPYIMWATNTGHDLVVARKRGP